MVARMHGISSVCVGTGDTIFAKYYMSSFAMFTRNSLSKNLNKILLIKLLMTQKLLLMLFAKHSSLYIVKNTLT